MISRCNEIRNNLAKLNKDIREAQNLRKSLRKEIKVEKETFQQQIVDAIIKAGPNGITSVELAAKFEVPTKEISRNLPHMKYKDFGCWVSNKQLIHGRSICVDNRVLKRREYALIMEDGTVNTNIKTSRTNRCNHYIAL